MQTEYWQIFCVWADVWLIIHEGEKKITESIKVTFPFGGRLNLKIKACLDGRFSINSWVGDTDDLFGSAIDEEIQLVSSQMTEREKKIMNNNCQLIAKY